VLRLRFQRQQSLIHAALITVLRNLAGKAPSDSGHFSNEKVPMSAEFIPPSKELYRVVGVESNDSRTVIASGMELNEAKAARQIHIYDRKYAWIVVEPETG
jgi:hypothetical protein